MPIFPNKETANNTTTITLKNYILSSPDLAQIVVLIANFREIKYLYKNF